MGKQENNFSVDSFHDDKNDETMVFWFDMHNDKYMKFADIHSALLWKGA